MGYKELERLRQSLPYGHINGSEWCYNAVRTERLSAVVTMSQRELQTVNKHKDDIAAVKAIKAGHTSS